MNRSKWMGVLAAGVVLASIAFGRIEHTKATGIAAEEPRFLKLNIGQQGLEKIAYVDITQIVQWEISAGQNPDPLTISLKGTPSNLVLRGEEAKRFQKWALGHFKPVDLPTAE